MIYTDGTHLVADSIAELHSFAAQCGLPRCYFEGVRKGHPHYDLIGKWKLIMYRDDVAIVSSKDILTKSKMMT